MSVSTCHLQDSNYNKHGRQVKSLLLLTALTMTNICYGLDEYDTKIYNSSAGPVFTLPQWTNGSGWDHAAHYSTIQLADIDGNGVQELFGRGYDGIIIESWDSSKGLWNTIVSAGPFTNASGWGKPEQYRTIQAADVDGDKAYELIGRSSKGIDTLKWNGKQWETLASASPAFSNKSGWNQVHYYSTIQTADIDGDGRAELMARATDGLETLKWNNSTWTTLSLSNPKLADDSWNSAENYSTIQTGNINGDKAAELIAKGSYGIRTWSFNQLSSNAWNHPSAYGYPAFTGDQQLAYSYINQFLKLSDNPVRSVYNTDANALENYQSCLFTGSNKNQWNNWTELPTETCLKLGQTPITPPGGLTVASWNQVAEIIYHELGSAQFVSDYFNELKDLYSSIFADQKSIIDAIAQNLNVDDINNKKVNALYSDVFLAPLKASSIAGPVGSAVGGILSAAISAGLAEANTNDFQGKWSQALKTFASISEQNKDAINNSFDFVVGDGQLLTYVGQQKATENWNPSDKWVQRSTISNGRKAFATWVYQTLTPSLWKLISQWYIEIDCTNQKYGLFYYYVGRNGRRDCDRVIFKGGLFGDAVSKKQLKPILDPLSSKCIPTKENEVYWEYGKCSIGTSKKDFFMNDNGWRFTVYNKCMDCES